MQQRNSFVILDYFFALLPPENQKIKTVKKQKWKKKKSLKISSFDKKSTLRYYHFTQGYHNNNHIMDGSWDMEHGSFLPFYLPHNSENKVLKKQKKKPGDIIISHMCNINDYHMTYGSWDMEHDGQNFLSFRPSFALLPH